MKKIIYWVAAFLCMACSDDHGSNQENGGASGSVTEVTPVTSDLSVDLSTDKAFYKPGEKVVFTAEDALPAGTLIQAVSVRRHLPAHASAGWLSGSVSRAVRPAVCPGL